jgi:hypothetical protein
MKPIGMCDICKVKPAVSWYNSSAAATCGGEDCSVRMQERWEAHCVAFEDQLRFEQEMRDEYGDDYDVR